MKKSLMLAGVLCAILILPGLASATHFESFDVTADCDGFSYTAEVYFRSTIFAVDVDYSVVLTDDQGAEVARFEGVTPVTRDVDRTVFLLNSGTWDLDLCGTFDVTASVHLYSVYADGLFDEDTQTFTGSFTCDTCDDPVEEACTYTHGYWKNHLDLWPQDHLTLGGVEYNQTELYDILTTPVRGDATIILAYQLIAAKLNVLSGADDSINDTIDAADAYLVDHPLFSRPAKDDKKDAIALKNDLVAYNQLPCSEEPDCPNWDYDHNHGDDGDGGMGKSLGANEETTFDNLKAMFK